MSYGDVYIQGDIKRLKAGRLGKEQIIDFLSIKLRDKYPDIPEDRAKRIIRKNYEGKRTNMNDWRKG